NALDIRWHVAPPRVVDLQGRREVSRTLRPTATPLPPIACARAGARCRRAGAPADAGVADGCTRCGVPLSKGARGRARTSPSGPLRRLGRSSRETVRAVAQETKRTVLQEGRRAASHEERCRRAPATGPTAVVTVPQSPEPDRRTARSRAWSPSRARNAQVGPDPEIIAPSAPSSRPSFSSRRSEGRSR